MGLKCVKNVVSSKNLFQPQPSEEFGAVAEVFLLDKDGKLWLHPNLLSLCVMSFFIVRNTNNFIFE